MFVVHQVRHGQVGASIGTKYAMDRLEPILAPSTPWTGWSQYWHQARHEQIGASIGCKVTGVLTDHQVRHGQIGASIGCTYIDDRCASFVVHSSLLFSIACGSAGIAEMMLGSRDAMNIVTLV